MGRVVALVGFFVLMFGATRLFDMGLNGDIDLSFGSNRGDRVVFIGRGFALSPGILNDVEAIGTKSESAPRLNVFPPVWGVPFWANDVAGVESLRERFSKEEPAFVVLKASMLADLPVNWREKLMNNLATVATLSNEAGARTFVIANPPIKPQRSLGYPAAVQTIETVVSEAAEKTGSVLVRAGAFFAGLPEEERMTLYADEGVGLSKRGDIAVSLMIATALGSVSTDTQSPDADLVPDEVFAVWRDQAINLVSEDIRTN
ncbi:MAG: hypothetical protein AAGG57_16350 [Pseudomonadota bacterium]